MSHKKTYKPQHKAPAKQTPTKAVKPKKPFCWNPFIKICGFVLLFVFCTFIYGDVFVRAQQDAFVVSDATSMKFLTDTPFGHLFWFGRYLMVVFKSKWVGGLILSALLMAIACQLDAIFRIPARWRGIAFLLPIVIMTYIVELGTNLYYKAEPSRLMLIPFFTLVVLVVVAQIVRFLHRGKEQSETSNKGLRIGILLAVAGFAGLYADAMYRHQNDILGAKMQNKMMEQDWEGMIDDAMSARRPTRTVAAYHAIALLRTDQLLDRLFEIPYNYPDAGLKKVDGSEEYGLLQADCDFAAGLVQPAYHYAFERIVMDGPTTRNLKRCALCAILTGEKELAEKYLNILKHVPFEQAFVNRYEPMLNNPKLIDEDSELAGVKKFLPKEDLFEQNYRQPVFLGYNLGVNRGSNETLITSAAACLYSKDLVALLPRINFMVQNGMPISQTMQEALACLAIKQGYQDVVKQYGVNQMIMANLQSFLMAARPYTKDKEALRANLKKDWLGTYFYYYFCENNEGNVDNNRKNKGQVN